ncbi:hypothetical protein FHR71_005472 [Methylobacterium sp. RAS18]|nr:hypothetical protein [Methylobacterium sp. RAS18]
MSRRVLDRSRFSPSERQTSGDASSDIFVDRRVPERRTPTMQLARVILPCGKRLICVIRDVSPKGAKINISRRYQLAEAFRLELFNSNKKFIVECAWRRGDYVGVKLIPVSVSENVFR